jgi:hypothetical protein
MEQRLLDGKRTCPARKIAHQIKLQICGRRVGTFGVAILYKELLNTHSMLFTGNHKTKSKNRMIARV